jgi:hypothetical protein
MFAYRRPAHEFILRWPIMFVVHKAPHETVPANTGLVCSCGKQLLSREKLATTHKATNIHTRHTNTHEHSHPKCQGAEKVRHTDMQQQGGTLAGCLTL